MCYALTNTEWMNEGRKQGIHKYHAPHLRHPKLPYHLRHKSTSWTENPCERLVSKAISVSTCEEVGKTVLGRGAPKLCCHLNTSPNQYPRDLWTTERWGRKVRHISYPYWAVPSKESPYGMCVMLGQDLHLVKSSFSCFLSMSITPSWMWHLPYYVKLKHTGFFFHPIFKMQSP